MNLTPTTLRPMREPRLYFDSAASTPVRPEALEAMRPYFSEKFGNPGSLHSFGQEAIKAVDESREKIAKSLGADFREIIFTSSATEANNIALWGALRAFRERHPGVRPRLVISSVEHESVLEPAKAMKKEGVDVVVLPVDEVGRVIPESLKKVLSPEIFLVSVMYANNEVGTVQGVDELIEIVKSYSGDIPFHTDAAQAFAFMDISPKEIGADLLTVSSHKICGPKGAAALFAKDPAALRPLFFGGGQEFGLRSGTENVAAVVGFAKAAELAAGEREETQLEVLALAKRFFGKIEPLWNVSINGEGLDEPLRLPHILNLRFPGKDAQSLLTELDLGGFAASAGSACLSRSFTPSHVLRAMGFPEEHVKESIRISFGRFLKGEDIDSGVKIIETILNHERKI